MPVFIGDVLESSGGPVLDLSTQQVRGLGVFNSITDREDLSDSMRSNAYLSVVGSTYPKISVHTGGDWGNLENWNSILKFVGAALKVTWFNGNINSTEGFLVGTGNADFLRKGDVFQISGINDAGDGNYADINDGAYLVVDDPWSQEGGNPNVGPSKASFESYGAATAGIIIEALQDYIDGGTIIRLSETKLLLESLPNAADLVDGEINAQLLSSTNPTDFAVSVTDSTGVIRDAKISVNQLISMLAAGISDEYVEAGYGDVTVYGGSAGTSSSGGDVNGDGLITVLDLIILLGIFGQEVDSTIELEDTVVSIPQSWGTDTEPVNSVSTQVGGFWKGGSDRYYAFSNWGTGPPNLLGLTSLDSPTVTSGAATVALFNAPHPTQNSNDHYTDNSLSLGDPFVFSSTPSNDFTINAFPANPSRLVLREPPFSENPYSGTAPSLPSGMRNALMIQADQANDFNNGSQFQTFVRVKKYSLEPSSVSDLGSNVINTRVVTVGDIPFSSLGVPSTGGYAFFNFINPNIADNTENETQESNISDLYFAQHGYGIFETEDVSCVAIGVELGIKITNALPSTSRNLGQGGSIDLSTFEVLPSHSAILQNIEVVLVPHNN